MMPNIGNAVNNTNTVNATNNMNPGNTVKNTNTVPSTNDTIKETFQQISSAGNLVDSFRIVLANNQELMKQIVGDAMRIIREDVRLVSLRLQLMEQRQMEHSTKIDELSNLGKSQHDLLNEQKTTIELLHEKIKKLKQSPIAIKPVADETKQENIRSDDKSSSVPESSAVNDTNVLSTDNVETETKIQNDISSSEIPIEPVPPPASIQPVPPPAPVQLSVKSEPKLSLSLERLKNEVLMRLNAPPIEHPYNLIKQSPKVYPYDYKCPFVFQLKTFQQQDDGTVKPSLVYATYLPTVKATCVRDSLLYNKRTFRSTGKSSFTYTVPWSNDTMAHNILGRVKFQLFSDDKITCPIQEMEVWTYPTKVTKKRRFEFIAGQDFAQYIRYINHETQKLTLGVPNDDTTVEKGFQYLFLCRRYFCEQMGCNKLDDKWLVENDEHNPKEKRKQAPDTSNVGSSRTKTPKIEKTTPSTFNVWDGNRTAENYYTNDPRSILESDKEHYQKSPAINAYENESSNSSSGAANSAMWRRDPWKSSDDSASLYYSKLSSDHDASDPWRKPTTSEQNQSSSSSSYRSNHQNNSSRYYDKDQLDEYERRFYN